MANIDTIHRPRKGRPRAPRGLLAPSFIGAVYACGKTLSRLEEETLVPHLDELLARTEVVATPATVQRLYSVAEAVGFTDPVFTGYLPAERS